MKQFLQRGAAVALFLSPNVGLPQPVAPGVNDATPVAAKTEARPKAADNTVPTVEVKASASDYDPRRDDTASKTVINQEELVKYGDTNVYDVLKRAPGVTVIGNTIRMRGLGAGYTQILVNGERPPPGFSLDDLPPDQIEKIEIMRAATAEFSMQAIAGTINIVLKKVVARPQRDLRLNTGQSQNTHTGSVSGTLADKSGQLSYYLTGSVSRNLSDPASTGGDRLTAPDGTITALRSTASLQKNASTAVILQPRLNWKLANDDQVNAGAFVQDIRANNRSTAQQDNSIGSFGAPDYTDRQSATDSTIRFAGLDLNWVTRIAGGKLDAKASFNKGAVDSTGVARYATVDAATYLRRDTGNRYDYTTWTSIGKYALSLSAAHNVAAGWDVSSRETLENLLRIDQLTDAPTVTVPETFTPRVVRLAVYAQDEWSVTKDWSIYLGARWEAIRTDSQGTDLVETLSRSHVLSPVAQTLYKFPDRSGRQLRLALTRTYKAPDVSQLSGRRNVAALNTRFTPDSSGNPGLQPELATGIDLTYEHFWAPGALFSVGTSARRITGYIRTTLAQDANGLWLYSPVNDGDVQVRTVDIELKFPLKVVWPAGPALDVRASVNRNWSHVDAVPGPGNRLDDQVPLTATAGLDYKRDKLTAGGSLALRAGGTVRASAQQSSQQYRHRDLDAYVLYKFTPKYQLRFALTNLLGEDFRMLGRYRDDTGTSETWATNEGVRRAQVSLEMKL